jgi:hypothetical protein
MLYFYLGPCCCQTFAASFDLPPLAAPRWRSLRDGLQRDCVELAVVISVGVMSVGALPKMVAVRSRVRQLASSAFAAHAQIGSFSLAWPMGRR